MFERLSNFFAPKAGDVRLRDVLRQVPSALAKQWGQPALRGYYAVGTEISKKLGTSDENTPLTDFEKRTLGTEKRPTAKSYYDETLGQFESGKKFGETKVGSVAAPFIGFGLGIADAITGGKASKVTKAGKAANSFKNIAQRASGDEIGKMYRFVNAVRTGAAATGGEATKFKNANIDDVFLSADDISKHWDEGMDTFNKYLDEFGDSAKGGNLKQEKIAEIFERVLDERKALVDKPVDIRRMTSSEIRNIYMQKKDNVLDLIDYDVLDLTKKPMAIQNAAKYPKEYRKVAEDSLEILRPNLEARAMGRLSHSQLLEEAKTTHNTLNKVIGSEETNKLAAQLVSTEMVATRQMEALDLALKSGDATKAADKLQELLGTLDVVKSYASHSGYMLRAQGIKVAAKDEAYLTQIAKSLHDAGVSTDEISKAVRAMKDPNNIEEAQKLYREFIQPKMSEWLNLIRYNSMLSSPLTHIINTTSNVMNGTIVRPLTRMIEGGYDFISHPINKDARTVFAGESGAYLSGYINSVGNAMKRFADTWQGKIQIAQPDLRRMAPLATEGVKGAAYKTLSTTTKLLESMDQFFMELTTGAELAALKYRANRGVDVVDSLKKAQQAAKESTFRKELFSSEQGYLLNSIDELTSKVESARNSKNPIVYWTSNLTIPFVHTVMNILKQGVEYSPAGWATVLGATNKQEQVAKATLGTAVALTATMYGMSGRITTQKPTDKNELELWNKSGKQEYSIKIGDKWVQYSKLPPAFAFPIAATAAFQEAFKKQKIDQNTYDALAGGLARTFAFYSDQSYFKGIGDIMNAITGSDPNKWDIALSNYPQQFVPFRALGGWIARLMDDTQRTIDDKSNFAQKQLELLVLNIPKVREQYGEPKLGSDGKPLEAKNRVRNAFMPFKTNDEDQKYADFLADYDKYAKINRDENRKDLLAGEQAREMFFKIRDIEDPQQKIEMVKELSKTNPEMLKKIVNLANERKGGISPEEMMIKNMSVEARANYIRDKVAAAQTPGEKRELVAHFVETGIMTKSVTSYIAQLGPVE